VDNFVKGLIWDWSEAKAAVKPNASLIVESNFDLVVMEACARRMKLVEQCENALQDISERPNLPQPLVNYFEARNDSACSQCWLSSAGPKHTECSKKIDRHFRTEEALFAFARQECKVDRI
jgi:hypothetical protein